MKNDYIFIMVQGFYGNRTGTEIKKEDFDYFMLGYVDKPSYPIDTNNFDRTVIRLPKNENIVFVYNKFDHVPPVVVPPFIASRVLPALDVPYDAVENKSVLLVEVNIVPHLPEGRRTRDDVPAVDDGEALAVVVLPGFLPQPVLV